MDRKICCKCKAGLCTDQFYDQRGHRAGKMSMCKSCFNVYCIERWRSRKIAAVRYKGSKCVECGLRLTGKNYAVFDFHHRNPLDKDVSWVRLRLRSWRAITSELDGCDLLCANCHRLKHSL